MRARQEHQQEKGSHGIGCSAGSRQAGNSGQEQRRQRLHLPSLLSIRFTRSTRTHALHQETVNACRRTRDRGKAEKKSLASRASSLSPEAHARMLTSCRTGLTREARKGSLTLSHDASGCFQDRKPLADCFDAGASKRRLAHR